MTSRVRNMKFRVKLLWTGRIDCDSLRSEVRGWISGYLSACGDACGDLHDTYTRLIYDMYHAFGYGDVYDMLADCLEIVICGGDECIYGGIIDGLDIVWDEWDEVDQELEEEYYVDDGYDIDFDDGIDRRSVGYE